MRSRTALFLESLILTLLLLLPMIGVVQFFAVQRRQQEELRQANAADSGVVVDPGSKVVRTVLTAVQQENPAFVLVRVDAPAAAITFCALPGSMQVAAPAGTTTLADCYLTAGPARAVQLLGETVGAQPDRYLAATPAVLAGLWPDGITARLDTAAYLTEDAREQKGLTDQTVLEIPPATAETALADLGADQTAPTAARLRAGYWCALFRQHPEQLPELVSGLRSAASRTLTDLPAQELNELEQAFRYLAGLPEITVDTEALPFTSQPGGEWELTEDGAEELRGLLGASETQEFQAQPSA